VIVAVVAGYFGYEKLYKEPREDKATTKSSIATRYYQMDSLNLALNGDGQNAGFLKIIKTYDGTSAANLARFYAGTCYLRMGDFNNAVKYLKDFNGKGTILAYEADGCIGDAYMEQGKIKDGITPIYLYRLGVAYEMDKQNAEAKKAFIRIRDEYPKSVVARDIDKELAQLGVLD
jgi:TolA-binding protein